MEIKCVVIDDEPLAISKLESFIARVPGLNLLRTFDSAVEAMSWLKENPPDLVFLDIQMEQLTGIQFLEATDLNTRIIITSAYDEYAIKGFELNVTDYLLKPFSFQRFIKAVDKVMEFYSDRKEAIKTNVNDSRFIFVKTEYRYERIDIEDILYIEGMKDYLRIICSDKKIMTLQSFSKIEESLPSGKFCRIHKSYMVALDKIRSVERGVVIIADKRIPISNTFKEGFYNKIKLNMK
jgi:two-component system, LytTR family, response regulator